MKYISILRHGKSPQNPLNDEVRVLSDEGIKDITKLSLKLKESRIIFDFIISSPIQRAKQTFEIVKSNQSSNVIFEFDKRLYSFNMTDVEDFFLHLDNKFRNVLLVGHNPVISRIGCYLCNQEKNIFCTPGNFFQFELDIESWKDIYPHAGKTIKTIKP